MVVVVVLVMMMMMLLMMMMMVMMMMMMMMMMIVANVSQVQFREKVIWTAVTLLIFLVCSQVCVHHDGSEVLCLSVSLALSVSVCLSL